MGAGDDFFAYVLGTPGRDIEFYWHADNRLELDAVINGGGRIDSTDLPDLEPPDSEDIHDWSPQQVRRFQAVRDYTMVVRKNRRAQEETQRRAQRYRDLIEARNLGNEAEEFLRIERTYDES